MMPVLTKKNFILLLLGVLLSVLYTTQLVQKAYMQVDLETSRRTIFKVYWPMDNGLYSEKRMSQIVVRPGRTAYSLRICNLGRVDSIRIDTSEKPATVTLKSITIKQAGYQPLTLSSPQNFEALKALDGIQQLSNGPTGLQVVPAGVDPQLIYQLPDLGYAFPYFQGILRIVVIFLLVFAIGYSTSSLWDRYSYVPLLLTFVLALILVMAGISKFDKHPDEPVHVAAAVYYQDHFLPAKIGDPVIRHTYSAYGVSRLHSGEIVYLIVGKFMQLIRPLHLEPYKAFRYFNIVLFSVLLLMSLSAAQARPLLLPLLISPQIWYVFSYADSDAFALFILLLLAYQLCLPSSWLNNGFFKSGITKKTIFPLLLLGLLVGLSLLVKKNFYFFHIFAASYLLWRAFFMEQEKKVFLKRCLILGSIGLAFAGTWRAADYAVNGFDRSAKLLQCREDFAKPLYKPSTPLHKKHIYLQMKDRGTTLKHFLNIDRWGEKSFRSSFGVYGYTSISASFAYYDFVRMAGLTLLVLLTATLVLRSGISGVTLLLFTGAVSLSLIAVAMYHAWTVDFQAQGRYFLPLVAMFAILVYQTRRSLQTPLVQLAVLAMFLLATYNFIFVGLYDIAKFGG